MEQDNDSVRLVYHKWSLKSSRQVTAICQFNREVDTCRAAEARHEQQHISLPDNIGPAGRPDQAYCTPDG